MKKHSKKDLCKCVASLVLVLAMLFSTTVKQAYAVTLPSWVYNAVFRVALYGANYLANNVNLKTYQVTTYDSHSWRAELGSIKFNNRSSNTGSAAGYKTKIATTWSQSRTRTNVFMYGTKRSFTTGSKYIALQVLTPYGVINDLERIRSGSSRLYEAYGNMRDLGVYDFRFVYTDSETWDLAVSFNDRFFPDVPVEPKSFGKDDLQNKHILGNICTQPSDSRLYRFPSAIDGEMGDDCQLAYKSALTLQELINEKTDIISNEEVDVIRHYNTGDVVAFGDIIKSVIYDSERNVTVFKFASTPDELRALEFYGDLTNDYSVGDYMQLKFHVVEIGNVNGIVLESFDYIEDYNFDGDAAPHIEPYL